MRLPAFLTLSLLAIGDPLALAQRPDTPRRDGGATVSGAVHDSLARAPLVGAMVQLVAVDSVGRFSRSVVADSLGRFAFDSVPDGRYALGFLHPVLDSLGLEPTAREVRVLGTSAVRADLSTPSPARLRAVICGPHESAGKVFGGGSIVVGYVRDAARGEPVSGASISAEWLELTFTKSGIAPRYPRLISTSWPTGWFFLCDVPSPGTVDIIGSLGADSTSRLEVRVPESGFLRLDLYLAASHAVARGDSLAPAPVAAGAEERLSGVVISVDGARPLAGAEVRLGNGARTRANERGEWTLAKAPPGTQMLEVRAVGYYPARQPVHVVPGGAPVRVALSELRTVLDTVRIRATRIADAGLTGFENRRRTLGAGRFLTPQDVMRNRPTLFSDVLRNMAGVKLERTESGLLIRFRGMMADWCAPVVWVDGAYQGELTADELDGWIEPKRVVGVEMYSGTVVPETFHRGMAGYDCGSLVIWTR